MRLKTNSETLVLITAIDELDHHQRKLLRILTIMNPHSYHREHLLYSRIGLGVFLRYTENSGLRQLRLQWKN